MLSTLLASSTLLLASSVLVDAAGFASRDPTFPSCQTFGTMINETRPLESEDLIISTGVVCNVSGLAEATSQRRAVYSAGAGRISELPSLT